MSRLVHTITRADVGKTVISKGQKCPHCGNRTGPVIYTHFMGGIQERDIAKRIYEVADNAGGTFFQVENDEQFKARTK